jgi:hypothetical protein
MSRTPALGDFPKRVGDLVGLFELRIRCPRCGRLARLNPDSANHRLALTDLLAKLQCNESRDHRKCGGRPEALEIRYTPPGTPHVPHPSTRVWLMDRAGDWTEAEHDPLDDLDLR